MNNSKLLKAYKKEGMISIKREYAGCYIATVEGQEFRIESEKNRGVESNEWVIINTSNDSYVTHEDSLTEAQIFLVNNY